MLLYSTGQSFFFHLICDHAIRFSAEARDTSAIIPIALSSSLLWKSTFHKSFCIPQASCVLRPVPETLNQVLNEAVVDQNANEHHAMDKKCLQVLLQSSRVLT